VEALNFPWYVNAADASRWVSMSVNADEAAVLTIFAKLPLDPRIVADFA